MGGVFLVFASLLLLLLFVLRISYQIREIWIPFLSVAWLWAYEVRHWVTSMGRGMMAFDCVSAVFIYVEKFLERILRMIILRSLDDSEGVEKVGAFM